MFRYFLKISYLGTKYNGWQKQLNTNNTIQYHIDKALGILLKQNIKTYGSSRTDTGVHAMHQIAQFDSLYHINICKIKMLKSLNMILPYDISILDIAHVNNKCHARYDAIYRTYRYNIHFNKDPYLSNISWLIINCNIDYDIIDKATQIILNNNSFEAFSKKHEPSKNALCNIKSAFWIQNKQKITFFITSNRYLRSMVRIIVGIIIKTGLKKMPINRIQKIIDSKNIKNNNCELAPPQGLHLYNIEYPYNINF
ncbi:MAG: tRNA pseudouridine(38-40) synthase TruA [Bacteroides sp.]|nr:MAG: tRNA pseudouridine(38-40) synthase TruA [Bacteroides sp.]